MRSVKDIEFRIFSQNGEDGIIDYLISKCGGGDRTFVEIGCGSGEENNTASLAVKGWSGVVFDKDTKEIRKHRKRFRGVPAHMTAVSPLNADSVLSLVPQCPMVFSLDIDSADYHVASALLQRNFRPTVAVIEYNATFHRDSVTVPYPQPDGPKYLYFGAGVISLRKLMRKYGYRFITVDSSGTNAAFVLESSISADIDIDGVDWKDSAFQLKKFGSLSQRRSMISHLPVVQV